MKEKKKEEIENVILPKIQQVSFIKKISVINFIFQVSIIYTFCFFPVNLPGGTYVTIVLKFGP